MQTNIKRRQAIVAVTGLPSKVFVTSLQIIVIRQFFR